MSPVWRTLSVAFGVVAVAAAIYVLSSGAEQTSTVDLTRARSSDKGLYAAAIEPEDGTFRQGELHSWLLTLTTPDGAAVPDAGVRVDGGMPEHSHGLPTRPVVSAHLGDGRYRIEGVKFTMAGRWEFRFAIDSPRGADTVAFNIMM